jgi:RNA polymerase sigma-54 factor
MSSLRLTTALKQQMVLTPQLRQRIEMLQMTSLELSDLIQTELIANPILEEVENDAEISEISENILDQNSNGFEENGEQNASENNLDFNNLDNFDSFQAELPSENGHNAEAEFDVESYGEEFQSEKTDVFEEIDFGREFQDYLDPGYKTQEIEIKEDGPSFEQFLTHSETLTEHLNWQVNLLQIDDDTAEICEYIVGNLNEEGRLSILSEEIAISFNCSVEVIEKARNIVMKLEPVGCGARNVQECLLVQLIVNGFGDRLACQLIRDHFQDLQPHRLQHLSKQVGANLDEISEELKIIKTLDPYPGRRYASEEAIYVTPEVYIEKVDDEYVIYFADEGSSRLRISQTYQEMLGKNETTRETKDFIKDKMRSAVDLLRNIEHRRQTIYRVVECIIDRQKDFLDKGVEHIRPMMLKDVAEDIGMHLSTISRVVNRKYANTPQGVIELRRFFSEGMLNEDGEEVSTRIIKLRIKKLIEEEDSRKPITDDDIAKILGKEGIKLSRRTVAKYRDQMQIAGSRERKTVV